MTAALSPLLSWTIVAVILYVVGSLAVIAHLWPRR